MREAFWSVFYDLKYKQFYLETYRTHAERINNAILVLGAIASASTIAGWKIWEAHAFMWSIILAIAQIVQVVKPYMPYAKRLQGAQYALPEVRELLIEIEHAWNRCGVIHTCSDDEYNDLIQQYRKQYRAIENKYMSGFNLPIVETVQETAIEQRDSYFRRHYNIEPAE